MLGLNASVEEAQSRVRAEDLRGVRALLGHFDGNLARAAGHVIDTYGSSRNLLGRPLGAPRSYVRELGAAR